MKLHQAMPCVSAIMLLVSVPACASTTVPPGLAVSPENAAPVLDVRSDIAIASTQSGRVQGFVKSGIQTFRGVPYATAARFAPPTAPQSWDGVRPALSYGNICPQPVSAGLSEPQTFLSDWRFWPQSENCLNLNVWTPALDEQKRPVMVWFHGGGFFSGSSMELPVYDGENLSRMGDVVVVSVNHRLNILGFLDLSAYGEQYQSSGNAGLQDLVAALEWVRDNAAAFGGDPDNVTIFGQSGGGGKVSTLLGAPFAAGLFDKAIIMSGAMGGPEGRAGLQDLARRVTERTFVRAGLEPGDIAGLQALPYAALETAGAQALMDISREMSGNQGSAGGLGFPRANWGPVEDGAFLPRGAFAGGAPSISANVPLLIGSTLSEFQHINPRIAGHASWSDEQLNAYLQTNYGERATSLVAAFREAYPERPLHQILEIDAGGRSGALGLALAKSRQLAPVYNYLFAWRSPVLDYGWAAGHTSDVAFVFNNAALGIQSSGGGPRVDRLTRLMTQSWINFARSGNPNADELAEWPRFTQSQSATMIFDDAPYVGTGHDAELIALLGTAGLAATRP